MSDAFFEQALEKARQAEKLGEIPIGAVLVKDSKVIAAAHNSTEADQKFTSHAELLCIEKGTQSLGSKYLVDCDLYVTLEPCMMCHYAARLSRMRNIFYLLSSESFGANGKAYHPIHTEQQTSPLSDAALSLLQSFFQQKR